MLSIAVAFAALVPSLFAEEEAAATQANPELEEELKYIEELVNNGFPDFAEPLSEAAKKRWPEAEARLFAIDVRALISFGKFDEAEKKIAALPDRTGTKYWAARLEVANNLHRRGQRDECMKIYDAFFKAYPKPPKDIRKFYDDASRTYGDLLVGDQKYDKAAERYEALLSTLEDDDWCDLACDTADLYLKLLDSTQDKKKRDEYYKAARKLVERLLYMNDKPVFFGRAISMLAHLELSKGDPDKAAATIDEYYQQLLDLHNQIVEADPDGKQGYVRFSPLPQCLYLKAKILWDAAKKEYAQAKRDDEKVKSYLFGPKTGGKRETAKGAFAIAQGIFLNYETSTWAPVAGSLAQEIKAFAEEKYGAKIKINVTAEQFERVRKAQYKAANDAFVSATPRDAAKAYDAFLANYPEVPESIVAIENTAGALMELSIEGETDEEKAAARLDCDTVEAYLSERFCLAKDRLVMTSAGDALTRLAAKEEEFKNHAQADLLFAWFCSNYVNHAAAAARAVACAGKKQQDEDWEGALAFWKIVETLYPKSTYYATSLSQISSCYGKLGDQAKEIAYLERYLEVETIRVRKLQARVKLAQMYQKDGVAILDSCANSTNEAETVALENRGTAQIIRAIKNFNALVKEIAEAMEDPSTSKEDKEKYVDLKEKALFLIGECWSRMKRPEAKVAGFRAAAAKAYEEYLKEYPDGQFSKVAYVKLGMIYTALGDMAKAKDALDSLTRKFPDSDEAKNAKPRLAKSLMEIGMKREGTDIYAEMLDTDGKYTAWQYLSAGDALVDSSSWSLANRAYEKAIKLAPTNSTTLVGKARIGIAKSAWKQGSLAEAREALDAFLADEKLSKSALQTDANFMLADVARAQGRQEKDPVLRGKHFNAASFALDKVRNAWRAQKYPASDIDAIALRKIELNLERANLEEAAGDKEAAATTRAKAANGFQGFIQAHAPSEERPFDKMEKGELDNLERAYANAVRTFSLLGAEQADRVIEFGGKYLELFPRGASRSEVENLINKARADLPAAPAQTAAQPETEN